MTQYFLKVDSPNMAKGEPVSIPGLGTFENGSGNYIGKEEADSFRTYQTDSGMPNRTLLQAFKNSPFVVVETYDESKHGKPEVAEVPEGSEAHQVPANSALAQTPLNTNEATKTGDNDKDGDK